MNEHAEENDDPALTPELRQCLAPGGHRLMALTLLLGLGLMLAIVLNLAALQTLLFGP